jgi:hypothetical protein
MLTSTYILVALSVEQTSARTALHTLLDDLHALPGDMSTFVTSRAIELCGMLRRVYDGCHWRKLDKFLVPALRSSTGAANGLLADLEALSSDAAAAMSAAEACVADAGTVPRGPFRMAVERCVAALRLRLEREEHELFPLACSAVGREAWLALAHQMLAYDSDTRERRTPAPGPAAGELPVAAERLQLESMRWRQALFATH